MMQSAGARYRQLEGKRDPFLRRARDCAALTIPSLMPPDSHTGESKLPTPFQGLGARGVNNLSSKLLLALLPPNSPFFRLTIDDYSLEQMTQQEGMRAEVEEALGKIERATMSEVETSAVRVTAAETIKQLVVSGNALLFLPYSGGAKMSRLDRYVVSRDPMGNVIEIIVKESVSPLMLPEEIRAEIAQGTLNPDKTVDLFTRVVRNEKGWDVYQEVKDIVVPGTQGTYPADKSPWIPLRFTKIDGEDYGRS